MLEKNPAGKKTSNFFELITIKKFLRIFLKFFAVTLNKSFEPEGQHGQNLFLCFPKSAFQNYKDMSRVKSVPH